MKILRNNPKVLIKLTPKINEESLHKNEGNASWSIYQVIGNLAHGEKTDWIPRIKIILNKPEKTFDKFDRESMRS